MSIWVYQHIANGRVNRVPQRVFSRFFDFTGTIQPTGADEFVRLVMFTVKIENRRPRTLLGEHYTKYRVSTEGVLDADHWRDAKRIAMSAICGLATGSGLLPDDDNKIVGYRQIMQRREQALHRWEPTQDDLNALGRDLRARGFTAETFKR